MQRPPWLGSDELIVDLFAGGGGASEGIYLATGRHPDVAINHDPAAVAVHTRNHPTCRHFCQDIWQVKPHDAVGDQPVGLLWASPSCTHFSRAAGGTPKSKQLRSLPGVVLTWATRVQPRMIAVENVEEMENWGPLLPNGTQDPNRMGRSFRAWVGRLRGLGYKVEWKALVAADYGAPTIRKRLMILARCDGHKIVWPAATHSKAPSLFEKRWRPAADCIDWYLPCPSIFTRKRPLKDATMSRIAQGIMRYVVNCPDPFILPVPNRQAVHISELYGTSVGLRDPAPTLTCANRGEHAVVAAFLAQHNGGNVGHAATEPFSTILSGGHHQQVVEAKLSDSDQAGAERVAAFIMHYFSSGKQGQSLAEPLGAATTRDRYALVCASGTPIIDIGMRMLAAHELQAAQGFRPDYDLTDGGRLTKTDTIRLIGNSVCPDMACAVIGANLMPPAEIERIAA